jgi:hypothetical protein
VSIATETKERQVQSTVADESIEPGTLRIRVRGIDVETMDGPGRSWQRCQQIILEHGVTSCSGPTGKVELIEEEHCR